MLQSFAEKTFVNSHKTVKVFSLKSFPLQYVVEMVIRELEEQAVLIKVL